MRARAWAGWATSATGCRAKVATRMRPSSLACLFMIERLLSDFGSGGDVYRSNGATVNEESRRERRRVALPLLAAYLGGNAEAPSARAEASPVPRRRRLFRTRHARRAEARPCRGRHGRALPRRAGPGDQPAPLRALRRAPG